MEYLNRDELVRLFKVARSHNPLHHVALLVGLLHGLRVSETLAIRGHDICDGKVSVTLVYVIHSNAAPAPDRLCLSAHQ
jgi:hypothetical protein